MSWEQAFNDNFEIPKGSFSIHRPDWLCKFVGAVGGQRGKVAAFLIKEKDARNRVLATNRQISAQTGVALATVNSTLQKLRKAGCIKSRTAAIMLNPGISRWGNRQREAYLLKLYADFGNNAH